MDFDEFQIAIGERVKHFREKANLTQEDMDQGEFAVNTRTLQRVEAGIANMRLETLFLIARRLEIEPKRLFEFK